MFCLRKPAKCRLLVLAVELGADGVLDFPEFEDVAECLQRWKFACPITRAAPEVHASGDLRLGPQRLEEPDRKADGLEHHVPRA